MEQKRRIHGDFDALYAKYGTQLRFPVYLGQALTEAPLEELHKTTSGVICIRYE